jgi:hypothetical protein
MQCVFWRTWLRGPEPALLASGSAIGLGRWRLLLVGLLVLCWGLLLGTSTSMLLRQSRRKTHAAVLVQGNVCGAASK